MFGIPTPLSLVSWICTVRGWVVLCSACLAAGYFAVAWVLREKVFPILKELFEFWLVEQFFKDTLSTWIADVKELFYGALLYFLIGTAGFVGAVCAVGILLWVYAPYLLIGACIGGYKVWIVFQTIVAAEDDIEKACNLISGIFDVSCDSVFDKIKEYTYGACAIILLLQFTTFICVVLLIRRIHKDTGAYFFTFCGLTGCGGSGRGKKKNTKMDDLEKAIPLRRRRTRRAPPTGRQQVEALPAPTFDLPRRVAPAKDGGSSGGEAPVETFELRVRRRSGGQQVPRRSFSSVQSSDDSTTEGRASTDTQRRRRTRSEVEEEEAMTGLLDGDGGDRKRSSSKTNRSGGVTRYSE